jgi:metal-responsive CopG/Arc/MetJ family transcriptional regulator
MPPRLEPGTTTERIQLKAPASWVERIDEWRAQRRPIPTRNEAIRMLVDQALDAAQSGEKPAKPGVV